LLVCRTWCQDARAVFFSANRLVIHDFSAHHPLALPSEVFDDVGYPYRRLAASQFLRDIIPPQCIAHLRFLELAFPPFPAAAWPRTTHVAMQDWRETVVWLRGKINGPALTVRLVAADAGRAYNYVDNITEDEADGMHRAYMDLLQPLKRLAEATAPNRLSRFYADLRYPWLFTPETENRRAKDGTQWLEEEKRATNQDAERFVMGGRYDNMSGTEEPEQSFWKHVAYRHEYLG
jgi:hypothetical protein